jgi:predicted RNase H-like HicB family nuclease
MKDLSIYPFEIRPLSKEEGGGYMISFTDFSECISDGETIAAAIENGMDALQETIAALKAWTYLFQNQVVAERIVASLFKGYLKPFIPV